jgi:hypothetical protein
MEGKDLRVNWKVEYIAPRGISWGRNNGEEGAPE